MATSRPPLLPLALCALAAPSASFAQDHEYAGPAWERDVPDWHLPSSTTGDVTRVETGRLVGDVELDVVFQTGDHVLLARDFASLVSYRTIADVAEDFAVWHRPTGDCIAVATDGGLDLYEPLPGGSWEIASLLSGPCDGVREVNAEGGPGLAVIQGQSVTIFDSSGSAAAVYSMSSPIVDVAVGNILVDQSGEENAGYDVAILTTTELAWFHPGQSTPSFSWGVTSTTGELQMAEGSVSGLDLLLWNAGEWLVQANETWVANAIALGDMQIERMHLVDYFDDPAHRADLVAVDRTTRKAWVLERQTPAVAASTGYEFYFRLTAGATITMALDDEPSGAPFGSTMADTDGDGDDDLLVFGAVDTKRVVHVRPGERLLAEDQRPRLHYYGTEFRKQFEIPNVFTQPATYYTKFDPIDTAGNYLPVGATHLEITVWRRHEGSNYMGAAPIAAPDYYDLTEVNSQNFLVHEFPEVNDWNDDDWYFLRFRAVTRDSSGGITQTFPSRVERVTYEEQTAPPLPTQWFRTEYVFRTNGQPEGTGSVRGGGSDPTPPGSGG